MESQLTRDGTRQDWTPSRWQRPLVRASFLISALSLLVFLGLAVIVILLLWHRIDWPRLRITFVLGLVALLLLIGFSRLYVRDHYLGDVLAGYAVGLSWLALCAGVWAAYRPQRGVLQ